MKTLLTQRGRLAGTLLIEAQGHDQQRADDAERTADRVGHRRLSRGVFGCRCVLGLVGRFLAPSTSVGLGMTITRQTDPICALCGWTYDPETLEHKRVEEDDHWPMDVALTGRPA